MRRREVLKIAALYAVAPNITGLSLSKEKPKHSRLTVLCEHIQYLRSCNLEPTEIHLYCDAWKELRFELAGCTTYPHSKHVFGWSDMYIMLVPVYLCPDLIPPPGWNGTAEEYMRDYIILERDGIQEARIISWK